MSRLHQTTVRFDIDTWEQICAHAERLGLHRAAFIREAAQARIVRGEAHDELDHLRARVDRLEALLTRALQRRRPT